MRIEDRDPDKTITEKLASGVCNVLIAPPLAIFAVNTLFGVGWPYSWQTWSSVVILCVGVRTVIKVK